jgi:hypothetical protein
MYKAPTTATKFEIVPKGTHAARLYSWIELGIQESEYKGELLSNYKIYLTFEIPNEMRDFEGTQKPMVIGSEYTFSMGSKANLRPVVEALIGTTLTDAEGANFDFDENALVGRPCMISVIHKVSSKGNTYAKIESVVPMVKGMECPKQFNEDVVYKIEDGDNDVFQNLPKFLREKIMACKNNEKLTGDDAEYVRSLREGGYTHINTKESDEHISEFDTVPF